MNKKIPSTIGIGIILIIAIIIGLFFWIQSQSKIGPTGMPVQDEINTEQEINTANWQTYQNEEYGFEIKYPKDWKLEKNSGINFKPSIVSITSPETILKNNKSLENGSMCEGCGQDISFYYHSTIEDLTPNKYEKMETLDDLIEQDSLMKLIGARNIDGIKARELTVSGLGAYYVIMIEKEKSIYEIFFNNATTRNTIFFMLSSC
jgi:hypothetical protein